MSKITLIDLANLQNETTAVNAINTNSTTIQTAFDNTLSRDGTAPNSMNATLDMNSNQILNLPTPSTVNSPARLIDVTTNPTITIPPTGTSGHVVPFLDGNNTWSGTTTTTDGFLSKGNTGIGYSTGAGGTVTQLTSRTTGVTLNKVSGAITLFTAAGSATPASFTVTNSTVAATDVIILSVSSGTNVYVTNVTAVGTGSFQITFNTTGGTTSDAPVFNFAVIKAINA